MTVLIQFYLQNSRWAGFGPQVIVHWCILSRYTKFIDSLNNYSNFSCVSWALTPSILMGFFFLILSRSAFLTLSRDISGWGTILEPFHSFTLFAYFSVCHQLTLFSHSSLNLTLIMLDNDKLFFKGVEPVYMSVSTEISLFHILADMADF